MTDPTSNKPATTTQDMGARPVAGDGSTPKPAPRSSRTALRRDIFVALTLAALAIIATFITSQSPMAGLWTWPILAAVYAVTAMWTSDRRWRTGGQLLLHAAAHWAGFLGVGLLVVFLRMQNVPAPAEPDADALDPLAYALTGGVAPLLPLLTLAAFYAGMRFGRAFLYLAVLLVGVLALTHLISNALGTLSIVGAVAAVVALLVWRAWSTPYKRRPLYTPMKDAQGSGVPRPATSSDSSD